MTTRVDAIYQGGVFRPLEPVAFCENERVALSVQSIDKEDALAWANRVSRAREEAAQRYGILPDSAIDIAMDRMR